MIRIRYEPSGDTSVARAGETLMERLHSLGAPIEAACRGNGACGTCVVWVEGGGEHLDPPAATETALLRRRDGAPRARLSCQARLKGTDGEVRVRTVPQRVGRGEADRRARIFRRSYLDHLTRTGVTEGARRAWLDQAARALGGTGAPHAYGARAREAARDVGDGLASILGCDRSRIDAAAGYEEAIAMLVGGLGRDVPAGSPAILVGPWEGEGVRRVLEGSGAAVRALPTGPDGMIPLAAVRDASGPEVRGIFLSWADRWIGRIQPVEEIARAAGDVPVLVDATTISGRGPMLPLPPSVAGFLLGPDAIGGPSGPCLLVSGEGRSRRPVWPWGGAPSEGRLPLLAGLAEAVRERVVPWEKVSQPMARLADALRDGILDRVPGSRPAAPDGPCLAGVCAIVFEGFPPDRLGDYLDWEGVAARWGAEPRGGVSRGGEPPTQGHVGTGLTGRAGQGLVTFSTGWTSQPADIERAVDRVARAAQAVHALEPEPLAGVHYLQPESRPRVTPGPLDPVERRVLEERFEAGRSGGAQRPARPATSGPGEE